MSKRIPPRLMGLKARRAPIIVIIRRGPARWTQLIRWHTGVDHFEEGQWVKAHVFPRRSDLSPDGQFLIYFATNYANRKLPTWTAIGRPPYWSAVRLFKHGDSWGGGGTMVDNTHYKLNGHHGEDYPFFADRLERDGWQTQQEFAHDRNSRSDIRRLALPHPEVGVTLVMTAHATSERRDPGKGCYFKEYALRDSTGRTVPLADVEWADWDHRGRLVYARRGEIFAARPDGSDERLLFTATDGPPVSIAPTPSALAPADLKPFEVPMPKPAKWAPAGRPKKKPKGNQ